VAHGAVRQDGGRTAKDAKTPKGAKPVASGLAEDKLSAGAKADLAKVRATGEQHDPALDQALANAGKAKAAKKAKGPVRRDDREGSVNHERAQARQRGSHVLRHA
jgi:hypothetical protein